MLQRCGIWYINNQGLHYFQLLWYLCHLPTLKAMYVIFSFKFCISPKAFTLGPTFYYYYFFPKASSQFIRASDAAKPFLSQAVLSTVSITPHGCSCALDTHYEPTSSPEFQAFFRPPVFFFLQMGAFLPTLALKFRSKSHLWPGLCKLNYFPSPELCRASSALFYQRIHLTEFSCSVYLSSFLNSFLHPWAAAETPELFSL